MKINKYINILLLLILIFYIINKTISIYYENFQNNKKCLLLLYGESFRDGGQSSRTIDTERSYKFQKAASTSHMNFINYLKEKHNIYTDVIINTYNTKYENDFKSWYKDNLKIYNSNKELIGFNNLVNNIIKKVITEYKIDEYEFIILTRCDIYLKPEFHKIFNPFWGKIMFASQEWTYYNCGYIDDGQPRVNHTIKFIPKKYFNLLNNTISADHDSWSYYKKYHNLKDDDMDFILNAFHDADSYKDFNPLYYMVSRPENQTWHDRTEIIDKSKYGKPENLLCNKGDINYQDDFKIQHNL